MLKYSVHPSGSASPPCDRLRSATPAATCRGMSLFWLESGTLNKSVNIVYLVQIIWYYIYIWSFNIPMRRGRKASGAANGAAVDETFGTFQTLAPLPLRFCFNFGKFENVYRSVTFWRKWTGTGSPKRSRWCQCVQKRTLWGLDYLSVFLITVRESFNFRIQIVYTICDFVGIWCSRLWQSPQ